MWRSSLMAFLLSLVLATSACTVTVDVDVDALVDLGGGQDSSSMDVVDAAPLDAALDTRRDLGSADTGPADVKVDVSDASGDVADAGTVDVVAPPQFRYCPWETATLPLLSRSTLLLDEVFEPATSLPSPIDRGCENFHPSPFVPERVYVLVLDEATDVNLAVRCHAADCNVMLLRGSCLLSSIQHCGRAAAEESATFAGELRAGAYLIIVEVDEPPEETPEEDSAPWEAASFDLFLALNRSGGATPCPTDGALSVANLAELGDCVGGVREVLLEGNTASAGSEDDVFPDCSTPGTPRDDLGGAPDWILRLDADAGDGLTRTVAATLEPGLPSWSAYLVASGAPCGASDAVVDCAAADDGPATVSDLTLFDGESLFFVVDGMGERAFEGGHVGPFILRVRVSDPSCIF